jgi:hypothetical protein
VKFCHDRNVKAWEECWGRLTLANGNEYIGMFKGGKFNGQGLIYSPDGSILKDWFWENGVEGEYGPAILGCDSDNNSHRGHRESPCWGRLTLANGSRYFGEFKDGKFNGNGNMTFPNGSRYFGEFKDDWFNGKGMIRRPNGSIQQSGYWKNGVLVGGLQ